MAEPQKNILEGTLAQMLGGAVAVTIVTGFASFDHRMAAGFETGFGNMLGVIFYIWSKKLRKR